MNKRQLGTTYEDKACEYLEQKGYKIIERNFRAYKGEIDIIAKDGQYLVFVEVKFRAKNSFGYSAEAVGIHKQRIIYAVAENYLALHQKYRESPCRFDVIAIDNNVINHITNAFGGL
ncbi:MAG: YraN family protein [Lachnospiraceae bacterium]|nr:YraN family protein [Lachnospiraceae bacterium]